MRRPLSLMAVVFTLFAVATPTSFAAPAHGPAPQSSVSQTIGAGSCLAGTTPCDNTGVTNNIGTGSCNDDDACDNATGTIGNNSCNYDSACRNSTANIGNNSCSVQALNGCEYAAGTIGDGSCGGNTACHAISATIGNNSCNSGAACVSFNGSIGNDSCNGAVACNGDSGSIGSNSCNGYSACALIGTASIPNNSCNGNYACMPVLQIVYVTPTGAGAKDGTSWSNAFDGLANALAAPGTNAGDEIWVAAGTYLPTVTGNPPARSDTFALRAGTWVYGGFAGNETARDQRDWVANPTILSGDIGTPGDATDNAYQVVRDAEHVTLDGFTVTAGNNDHFIVGDATDYGGGISTIENPTLSNLIVTGNRSLYGGGIGITVFGIGRPVLSNVVVTNNQAIQTGGGIVLAGGHEVQMTNVVISGNNAINGGGGIYAQTATLTLTNVTVSGNNGNFIAGGMFSDSLSSITIHNSIFWGNAGSQYVNAPGGSVNFDHSITQGGLPLGTTEVGGGNLSVDPQFVSPIVASAPTNTGDLHLQPTSPAMNAGANSAIPSGITTDIDGDARILSGTVDMGADEVRTTCTAGYWSVSGDDRTGSCTAASIGYYVDHSGATSQTACPDFKTTTSTGSDSASDCVAVSPYALKNVAISELQALLPTGSAQADKKLNKAIANINASLASWRWVDADSLSPLHGYRVFNKERHAVTWLWTAVIRANPSWSAVANDAINRLVTADRAIVVQAIVDSADATANAAANSKLAQADALIASNQRAKAIYKLRAAWLAVI